MAAAAAGSFLTVIRFLQGEEGRWGWGKGRGSNSGECAYLMGWTIGGGGGGGGGGAGDKEQISNTRVHDHVRQK